MAAPAQVGTEVVVGFLGFTYTGYLPSDGFSWQKSYNDKEEIKDTNGAMRTKLRMDQFEEWSGELIVDVPGAGDPIVHIAEGDTITITPGNNAGTGGTPIVAEVQSNSVAYNRGSLKLNIVLRKEVSLTYTTV